MPSSLPHAPLTSPSVCLYRMSTRLEVRVVFLCVSAKLMVVGFIVSRTNLKVIRAPVIKFFLSVSGTRLCDGTIMQKRDPCDKKSRIEISLERIPNLPYFS